MISGWLHLTPDTSRWGAHHLCHSVGSHLSLLCHSVGSHRSFLEPKPLHSEGVALGKPGLEAMGFQWTCPLGGLAHGLAPWIPTAEGLGAPPVTPEPLAGAGGAAPWLGFSAQASPARGGWLPTELPLFTQLGGIGLQGSQIPFSPFPSENTSRNNEEIGRCHLIAPKEPAGPGICGAAGPAGARGHLAGMLLGGTGTLNPAGLRVAAPGAPQITPGAFPS